MGYYTSYELTAYDSEKVFAGKSLSFAQMDMSEDILQELEKMNVFGSVSAIGASAFTKWYSSEKDMSLLSEKFSDVLFCLSGCGEDSEDMWVEYYLNGKCQRCPAIITYEDFNPTKLEDVKTPEDKKYSYQKVE